MIFTRPTKDGDAAIVLQHEFEPHGFTHSVTVSAGSSGFFGTCFSDRTGVVVVALVAQSSIK